MARLIIYLSDEEKALVEKRAKALGLSASKYARIATVPRARLNARREEKGLTPGRENW